MFQKASKRSVTGRCEKIRRNQPEINFSCFHLPLSLPFQSSLSYQAAVLEYSMTWLTTVINGCQAECKTNRLDKLPRIKIGTSSAAPPSSLPWALLRNKTDRWSFFWKGEEPETGMTRDDQGILSRLALSQTTLSFASTFQPTFVVFFSFLGFFWSVSSCQVNWNSSSTPGNHRKQTTETIAKILWCLRSQIDPLVFIILLFTGPFTSSFIMHLHFEWFETKKTAPKDHTFASILIHIQTSHVEYTIVPGLPRHCYTRLVCFTTWQTTESCLSGCGRSLNLLHHFANYGCTAMPTLSSKLWTVLNQNCVPSELG